MSEPTSVGIFNPGAIMNNDYYDVRILFFRDDTEWGVVRFAGNGGMPAGVRQYLTAIRATYNKNIHLVGFTWYGYA